MIARIAIQNINIVDFIKLMFQRIGTKYTRYTRIKAAAKKRGNPRLFKTFTVSPLPFILLWKISL